MDKNLPNLYTWSLQQNKHFGGKNFKFKFVIGDIYKAKKWVYLVRSCWASWFNYFPNEWLNDNRATYLQFDKHEHTNTHQCYFCKKA